MKVFFLTNLPSPYRVDFFNELGKLTDLTVCFERETASDRDKDWKHNGIKNFTPLFLQGKKIAEDKTYSFEIIKLLKKEKYDRIIISGYSSPTAMIAINYLKNKRIPYIFSCDGGLISFGENPLKKKLKTHFIKGASLYLSSGKMTDEYLIHYGASKEKIKHYPFTSLKESSMIKKVTKPEEKTELRRRLGLPDNGKILILTVGRFIDLKGFSLLLNAAASVKNSADILLVGGQPTEEYMQIINEKELNNVFFRGFMSFEKLSDYFKAADFFILPTKYDVWGLVINEAMCFGLPIASTTKCVAAMTLVDESNGIIFNENSVSEIEKTLERIVSFDSETLGRMGQSSINRIKEYSTENMARVHFDILSEIGE